MRCGACCKMDIAYAPLLVSLDKQQPEARRAMRASGSLQHLLHSQVNLLPFPSLCIIVSQPHLAQQAGDLNSNLMQGRAFSCTCPGIAHAHASSNLHLRTYVNGSNNLHAGGKSIIQPYQVAHCPRENIVTTHA